ncbi:MAG: PIN domain-containing protein [Nitrososphaerota archaeon]
MYSYYIDTSVIIARYKPEDELYEYSERFFKSNKANFYISPLTLVELYSILSRIKNKIILPFQEEILLDTLITFIVKDCKLRVISKTYSIERLVVGYKIRLPVEYYLAMRFAEKLKLKTMDLLHILYTWLFKRNYHIDSFITGDYDIINKADKINELFGIKILHPKHVN